VDVIDTKTLEKVKSIPTKGGIHNVYVTPDGKHVVAGSIAGRVMTVIDAATDQTLWTLFEEGVRPMAFETNADGSTKRIFVQLSNVHGFAVVDFAQRKEVARVILPDDVPPEQSCSVTPEATSARASRRRASGRPARRHNGGRRGARRRGSGAPRRSSSSTSSRRSSCANA
jgi:hypothetical protein